MKQPFDLFKYPFSGMAMEVIYGKRPLPEPDAQSGAPALLGRFFADEKLYED